MSNVRLAERLFPDYFSSRGAPLALSNVVERSILARGDFVYIPQNAWAWHGRAVGVREKVRRGIIRAGSEVAQRRSILDIRIGPMVKETSKSSPYMLANVLDEDFEVSLEEGLALGSPAWLPEGPNWVVPGSLWSYRNIGVVVDAFRTAREMNKELNLVFVGPMSNESGIREAVAAASKEERVHFITRRVSRNEILRAMELSQVTILSSVVEASPVTMLEAAAVGARIVAWDNPAFRFLAGDAGIPDVVFVSDSNQLRLAASRTGDYAKSDLKELGARSKRREKWVENFLSLACEADVSLEQGLGTDS